MLRNGRTQHHSAIQRNFEVFAGFPRSTADPAEKKNRTPEHLKPEAWTKRKGSTKHESRGPILDPPQDPSSEDYKPEAYKGSPKEESTTEVPASCTRGNLKFQ